MPITRVDPVIDHKVRKLCPKSYPNHPRGCPNWNKKDTCPPKTPLLHEVLDLRRPVYIAYNVFDFKAHCDKMKAKHPKWSQRQIENCLYWQPTARKALREVVEQFQRQHPFLISVYIPEAYGVNITATMKLINVTLEWPPCTVTYQIALLGYPLKKQKPVGLFKDAEKR